MKFTPRQPRQLDLLKPPAEDDGEYDGYLAIGVWPRDCANVHGYRPCPYARCRHHLLIDEVYAGPGAPSFSLNRARDPSILSIRSTQGRKPELSPDDDDAVLAAFEDLAVERLWELPDTCAREVARRAYEAEQAASFLEERKARATVMTFGEIAPIVGVGDEDELAEECADTLAGILGTAIEAGADPGIEEDAAAAIVERGRR